MRIAFAFVSLTFLTTSVIGCSGDAPAPAEAAAAEGEAHDHSGWWCAEHYVPEEVCTRCDASLVAEFKAKGDWCDEHELPDSQCFVCHPEHKEKFAELYETKYGEQPPEPTE